jgi:hypothetical protein
LDLGQYRFLDLADARLVAPVECPLLDPRSPFCAKLSKPNRPRTLFRTRFIAARSAGYALTFAVVVQEFAAPVRSDN